MDGYQRDRADILGYSQGIAYARVRTHQSFFLNEVPEAAPHTGNSGRGDRAGYFWGALLQACSKAVLSGSLCQGCRAQVHGLDNLPLEQLST